ncbi:MAG TPA: VOC family protein [Candidatus Limnocylindrales bacterium]|jgi:predicted enzyme related to lactoylglutathione lyase|nr:VOC family protein [Candidatus Limnocylindrales bacterium]
MVTYSSVFAGFAARDTDAAKAFYRDTLGLDVRDGAEAGIIEIHGGGGAPVIVYPKPDHQPATFTVLNLVVSDIDAAVDELTAKGVSFEQYDFPELKTDAKGIARGNGPSIAWLTDPDGNILSVLQPG